MRTVEHQFDITFSWYAPFVKVHERDQDVYVVVRASDTSIDRDNERVSPTLIEKMRALAREGKILFYDHHKATFAMGTVVGTDEELEKQDPDGFYPVIKLNLEHPFVPLLLKDIKEGKATYGVSIGGRHPKLSITVENGKVFTQITDAEIDHIALTRPGGAANPNTGIIRAIMKEIGEETVENIIKEALEEVEKQGEIVMSQVTPVPVDVKKPEEEVKEEEKKCEECEERQEVTRVPVEKGSGIDPEAIARITEELSSIRGVLKEGLEKRVSYDERTFGAEMEMAISLAKGERGGKAVFERSLEHGYPYGTYACEQRPACWSDPTIPFADPVGYLYPMDEMRFSHSYRHFLSKGWKWYLPEAAAEIFKNFVKRALELGRPVSYSDHPLLASQLPADIKVALPDYNANYDAVCKELFEEWKERHEALIVCEPRVGEFLKAREDDEGRRELEEREKKYGYKAASNANIKKPKEWADVPISQFADPVSYKYPVHTPENARAALVYFARPSNREFYTVDAQIVVLSNILKACLKYGIKVTFQPDDPLYWLLPKSIKEKLAGYEAYEDEDTEEKREAMRREAEKHALKEKEAPAQIEKSEESEVEKEVEVKTMPVIETGEPALREISSEDILIISLPVKRAPVAEALEAIRRSVEDVRDRVAIVIDAAGGKINAVSHEGENLVTIRVVGTGVTSQGNLRIEGKAKYTGWALEDVLAGRLVERGLSDAQIVKVYDGVLRYRHENRLWQVGWKVEGGEVTIEGEPIELPEK